MRKTSKNNWICIYSKKHVDETNAFFFSEVQFGSGGNTLTCMCHLRHKSLQIFGRRERVKD
jgi:hypothetical protein